MTVCGLSAQASKPLSEKDRAKLAEIARLRYEASGMDGTSLYRFNGRDILIVITEVKKGANAQRVGQVKASRSAGEYLQSATNHSVTVCEVSEGNSYSLKDKSTVSGSSISQNTSDYSFNETEESVSDKIVQSSITRVGHIEPLCNISQVGNNIVLAYFMILEK